MAELKITLKTEIEEVDIPINPAVATVTSVTHTHSAPAVTARIIDTAALTWHDPIGDKLKELEEKIDAWQNKFEFVDTRLLRIVE